MNNSEIIISDRLERLKILDFLWKAQSNATEYNPDGTENSPNIAKSLNIKEIRVNTHLETLNDNGLVSIIGRTRGGFFVKIIGPGTILVEDFFLELEKRLIESNDEEIKNYLHKIKQEPDLIHKHELIMHGMITISEVVKLVNTILSKLGFS